MENFNGNWVLWMALAVYFVAMALIGLFSYKKANTIANFTVGGRKAGAWVSAFSYGTTYFSAVIFIGYAGRFGWSFGWWAVAIGIGNALVGSYLAWKVLARRTREVTRRLEIKTTPEFFEKRFNSKAMMVFSSVLIFFFMIPYSASVYNGLAYLCNEILHIPYIYCMLAIAVIAAAYLVVGGYIASMLADFVQGIIMIVGTVLVVGFVIAMVPDSSGIADSFAKLYGMMKSEGLMRLGGKDVLTLISLVLLTSLGTWGLPQMIHKYYGVADDGAIKRGTIISTFFAVVVGCGAYGIGSFSRLLVNAGDIPKSASGALNLDTVMPIIIGKLPLALISIVLVLILAASVTTLSGITLVSCTPITVDVLGGVIFKKIKPRVTLVLTRLLCLAFIAFSFFVAWLKLPIYSLMSFSWGIVAGSFLASFILSLYWKGFNKGGAWCGMISGFAIPLGSIVYEIIKAYSPDMTLGQAVSRGIANAAPSSPLFGVIAMLASFIFAVAGTYIYRAVVKGKEEENAFFSEKAATE